MSATVEGWKARPLTPDGKDAHYAKVMTYDEEMRRMGAAARKTGWIVGGVGVAVGVVGMVCAASVLPLKPPPEMRYIEVDRSTGYVGEPASVKDAPKTFGEKTAEFYLSLFLSSCVGYDRASAKVMLHRCAVFSTPDQQARYADWIDPKKNPDSPAALYGERGVAYPDNFRFSRIGTASNGTQIYLVRYDLNVSVPGESVRIEPWSTNVEFQWHPELPMLDSDRTINLAGFQASLMTKPHKESR